MPSVEQLVRDAVEAEGAPQTRAAARLMSLLESEPQRMPELFRGLPQEEWPQPRLVLGVTGAPGSGKSTLTDQMVFAFRERHPERRIGVIAVDPSSPFTGGSVMGDRVRMMRHATDPQVFIRSLATRGHLGGLSLGVKGVMRVMGLIGCDMVIVETVGVGQSEVEVTRVADQVLVVLAPGQGDSIQMLKAGLMEIGDVFVVNKADRQGADQLHSQLMAALQMNRSLASGVRPADAEGALRRRPENPDVYLVSALEQEGIDELLDGLEARAAARQDRWHQLRAARAREDVREAVLETARRHLDDALTRNGDLQRVLDGDITVDTLAGELMKRTSA